MRVRLIYSKRGGACFVPHIALAQVFSRSATRAGFTLTMTQGFSPRAKITFGPELPAGVVALAEPVDMFMTDAPENITERMNSSLPEGFTVSRVMFPPDDAPNLGKSCKAAEYFIRTAQNIHEHAQTFYGDYVVKSEYAGEWMRLILSDPAQNPIGGLVKYLVRENIIAGWHEVNIVRAAIGSYDSEKDIVYLNE